MNHDYHFIEETSNKQKLKVFLILLIAVVIIITGTIAFTTVLSETIRDPFNNFIQQMNKQILETTSIGLFYAGLLGGLFFLPIPQEIFYYLGLIRGNHIILSMIFINAGYMLAQIINYYIGVRLNKPTMTLLSKKRVYKARRFSNKYGALGVFLFNFLPLPAPLLTFALGIAKYNIYRMLTMTLLGTFAKYLAILTFFLILN